MLTIYFSRRKGLKYLTKNMKNIRNIIFTLSLKNGITMSNVHICTALISFIIFFTYFCKNQFLDHSKKYENFIFESTNFHYLFMPLKKIFLKIFEK